MFENSGATMENITYASEKMREIARFLIEMRALLKNLEKTLESCFKPREISNVILAARKLSGFLEGTTKVQKTGLARKIGHSLMHCYGILLGDAAEKEDKIKIEMLENFKKCYQARWSTEVSSRPPLRQERRNKKNMSIGLPLAEDIQKLNQYLHEKIKKYMALIQEAPEPDHFIEISCLTSRCAK